MKENSDVESKELFLSISCRHNRVMKLPPRTIRIAWYRSEDGIPGIHFPPALWDMVCAAVKRQGGALPQDVIATYIDALIRMNTNVTSVDRTPINLEWLIYGNDDGEEPQAVLAFRDDAVARIARRWDTSEDKVYEVIADALLQSINEQYEVSCLS